MNQLFAHYCLLACLQGKERVQARQHEQTNRIHPVLGAKDPCQYNRQDSDGYTNERFNQDKLPTAIASSIVALTVQTSEHHIPAWQQNRPVLSPGFQAAVRIVHRWRSRG
jgi:hypothetical protein